MIADVSLLEVGPLRFDMQWVLGYDLAEHNRRLELQGDTPFDGVLGADVLEEYGAIIDWSTRSLYLLDEAKAKEKVMGKK